MMGSLYKSLSGLVGFTKALDNLSNNVANLNTPGFKANDVFFRELNSQSDSFNGESGQGLRDDIGNGVDVGGTATRFTQGKIQDTGVETDLAIDGRGFFILMDGKDEYYTRAGQFRFDENGDFVDPASGFKVAFLGNSGQLESLNIEDYRFSKAEKTTEVKLTGELNQNDAEDDVYEGDDDNSIEFLAFDADGKSYPLQVQFRKLEGNAWDVEIVNEDGTIVAAPHKVEFTGLGSVVDSTKLYEFDFQPFDVLEQEALHDAFDSGEALIYSDGLSESVITSFGFTDSNLILRSEESFKFSSQSGQFAFDENGFLIDVGTGLKVAARDETGKLSDFSIEDKLTTPAEPTTEVVISGNLDSDTEVDSQFPPDTEDPILIEFINQEGEEDTLSIRFERGADNWSVAAQDSEGNNLNTIGNLNFDADGNLIASTSALQVSTGDDENIEIKVTDESGEALVTSNAEGDAVSQSDFNGKSQGEITSIEFDDDGVATINYSNGDEETGPQLAVVQETGQLVESIKLDMSQLTSISGTATARIDSSDGRSSGQIQGFSFDDFGKLTINYFNGDSVTTLPVALAQVADTSRMNSIGGTMFSLTSTSERVVGSAGEGGMGSLAVNSVELSNVELSSEFADIIIVQRGYQASSQVLNVTNELIEELYNSVKGR